MPHIVPPSSLLTHRDLNVRIIVKHLLQHTFGDEVRYGYYPGEDLEVLIRILVKKFRFPMYIFYFQPKGSYPQKYEFKIIGTIFQKGLKGIEDPLTDYFSAYPRYSDYFPVAIPTNALEATWPLSVDNFDIFYKLWYENNQRYFQVLASRASV